MTRIALIFAATLSFVSATAVVLRAQVPEDLAQPKTFRALRLSSVDPKFKNADYRSIAPGATLELGRIEGHGRITHMWFTIAGKSEDHLRELVLRVYWDGAEKPAIESPLGDFFGLGFGRYVEFRSAPVAIGGVKAMNCYWPMPFAKGARLTMTNEGSEPVHSCYFNIDYRLDDEPATDARYFHTQYRQAFPVTKGEDYPILETSGRGHYVGTFLSVMANSDGWWGEGNDKFYLDGAAKPTIEGTGSEDYFCGAWDFQHAFSNPYSGVPLYTNPEKGGEKRGILNTCYRWHILDPVPFTKSLRLTIEHGRSGPNDDRTPLRNHYSSIAYYYLDRAEGDGPALPPHSERIPKLLPLPGVSDAKAGGEPFKYVQVRGKITYDDGTPIPAPHLRVTFIPLNPPKSDDPKIAGPKAKADVTSTDGTIPADTISSHLYGDGLLPGKHKVRIIPFDEHDQPMDGLVPPEYRDAKTTPVEVDTANPDGLIIKIKKPAGARSK